MPRPLLFFVELCLSRDLKCPYGVVKSFASSGEWHVHAGVESRRDLLPCVFGPCSGGVVLSLYNNAGVVWEIVLWYS
jgi:hypothetical protein